MNSKERVVTALGLGTPDMVPYGEFAIDFDTVEKVLGHKTFLRNKAGTQKALWEGRWEEVRESLLADSVAIAEAVELDIVVAGVLPSKEAEVPAKLDEDTYRYADGRALKYSPVTNDFTVVEWPRRDWLPSDEEIERAAEAHPVADYRLEGVKLLVEKFGKTRHVTCGGVEEAAMPLFGGMVNGLSAYVDDPGRITAYCEAACEGASKTDELWGRMGVDSVLWGADFSYNGGPFLSPSMFRELVLPIAKRRVESVHAAGMKVLKHCCGNNWALLDMFVEIGYDCYQSIQGSAGMELGELKERYGKKIALWGGVSVETLVSGGPEDVSRQVGEALRLGKPGGGYIFGTSHSVAVGTKYENWVRMMEEFRRMRRY